MATGDDNGASPSLTGGLPAVADAERDTVSLSEVGTSGLRRYGGIIQEEFLPELRGLRGVRVFQEMRWNDPTVGGMIRATKDAIHSVKWDVEADGEEAVDNEAEIFLRQCMDDMSHSWWDMVNEALSMIAFGWAYHEVVYKVRQGHNPSGTDAWGQPLPKSKFDDRRIGWRKIALRGQETLYRWDIDNTGGIRAMLQFDPVAGGGIRTIPIEQALLFRTDREKNNPEGVSMLRWAYRPWYFKKQLEEIEAIGIERDLVGMPVMTLPQGATVSDRNIALDMLQKLKSDESTGLVLVRGIDERHDWTFGLTQSSGARTVNTHQSIDRYSGEIALAFLAQFLRLGAAGGGSYALSRDQKDFFYLSITSILDSIEEVINNYLVVKLFEFNEVAFKGLKNPPKIKHGKVGQREMVNFVNAIKSLADAGLLGPVDSDLLQFFRTTLDLPEISADEIDAMDKAREEQGPAPMTPGISPTAALQAETAAKVAETKPDGPIKETDKHPDSPREPGDGNNGQAASGGAKGDQPSGDGSGHAGSGDRKMAEPVAAGGILRKWLAPR